MKKRTKIITVLAAASLTFGVLFATVGERHFNHCNKHHTMHSCHHQSVTPEDNSVNH